MAPTALARLVVFQLLLACGSLRGAETPSRNATALPQEEHSALAAFIWEFDADHRSVRGFYDMTWSLQRAQRLDEMHEQWQQKLARLQFESLSQVERIDYLLLRNLLDDERAEISSHRRRLKEVEPLLPFREAIEKLEQERARIRSSDPKISAAIVARFENQIKEIRERIERGRKGKKTAEPKPDGEGPDDPAAEGKGGQTPPLAVSPVMAKRAATAVTDLRNSLRAWFSFYDGYQPEFSWWLKKPYEDAARALEDYSKYLKEEIAGAKGKDDEPLLGEPVGADGLARQLATQMIAYTADELIAIGEQEFAWCEAQMKQAAREMGLGDDWKGALEKVKADFVPPGQQDDWVAEMARQAILFVKQNDLITVPPLCEETWRLSMISPDRQKTLPYAAYGGQSILVAYAREEMNHDDKLMSMRGNNRHFTRIVTAHELIPGHHLQRFQSDRHRVYRDTFSTPFFVEGWALYWELRLWEGDYGRSPEDRIGMLFWRMHRTARIIVSLKFHLGHMTPAEMVDFLVDRVGHEKLGATSEVRRYVGDGHMPLYQCAYMIGGMQLNALRREMLAANSMTERQFNDAVLTYNAIPIELIRAGMLQLPLRHDSRAEWRFPTQGR